MVKAYAYIRLLGAGGLEAVTEQAVINSNYLLTKLKEIFSLPYGKNCMHEFVLSGSNFRHNSGSISNIQFIRFDSSDVLNKKETVLTQEGMIFLYSGFEFK